MTKRNIFLLWLSAALIAVSAPPIYATLSLERELFDKISVSLADSITVAVGNYAEVIPIPANFLATFLPAPESAAMQTNPQLTLIGISLVYGLVVSDLVGKITIFELLFRWLACRLNRVRSIALKLGFARSIPKLTLVVTLGILSICAFLLWHKIGTPDASVLSGMMTMSFISLGAAVANFLAYGIILFVWRLILKIFAGFDSK